MVSSLKALGRKSLPNEIDVDARHYSLRQVFKNDFFATTGLYEGASGKVVLKVQRQASFLLVPLGWIGRLLTARELAALQHLSDAEGVPRVVGRWGKTGLVREYVEGRTLADTDRVPDEFHAQLRSLVDTFHRRGMAYVDLEKRENVIVGDDGRPYLIDFQIAWYWPRGWGGELWPARMMRRWFQRGDRYHLVKLQRRTRPDQLSPEVLAASYHKPWFVRLHSTLTRPLTRLRRTILHRLEPDRTQGERGRIEPEKIIGAVKQCL